MPPSAELPLSAAGPPAAGGGAGRGRAGRRGEREGQRPADDSEKSSCARPGCYELFVPRGAVRISGSVRACAARLYGE